MARTLLIFAAMGLVTYLLRAVALVLLPGRRLPHLVERWLEYVPAAVLAGLAAAYVFAPGGSLRLEPTSPWLLAAVPTVAAAAWRKSLWLTVVVGLIAFAALLAIGLTP